MTKFRLFLVAILLLGAWACDADQSDPYDDAEFAVDWPSSDPNRYHWNGFADPFFEGWFFRIVDGQGDSFAFIYGVQNPGALADQVGSAFLVAARAGGDVLEADFPVDRFYGSRQDFEVDVADNHASVHGLRGSIRENGDTASWDLDVTVDEIWTDTMGSLTNFPIVSVNWYVGAFRARATGWIEWNGRRHTFLDAPIFQDHNWGPLFPESYAWIQANEFPDPRDALVFAGGDLGVDAAMLAWRNGEELIKMRSQDLNVVFDIEPDFDAGELKVTAAQADRRLVVTGYFDPERVALLPGPREEGYVPFSRMALDGRLRVQLYEKVGFRFELTREVWSKTAGVEIAGAYLADSAY